MPAAAPAIPVNPKTPAIIATTKKTSAQLNIIIYPLYMVYKSVENNRIIICLNYRTISYYLNKR